MQNLLSPAKRPDLPAQATPLALPLDAVWPGVAPPLNGLTLSPTQKRVLSELQSVLNDHSIAAEPGEILEAILNALLARPPLCRALLAAYLLGRK